MKAAGQDACDTPPGMTNNMEGTMPKATNEHTTTGCAPPGATRRGILGTAAALLAGSAAGAADAAPPANPDAELLAQCAEFTALERRYAIVCHAAQTTEQEHATAPLTDAIAQRQKTLVSAMRPATTRQGMRAKAQCLRRSLRTARSRAAACSPP
jgi:hypothetical protein